MSVLPVRCIQVDRLKVRVYANRALMGEAAGHDVVQEIYDRLANQPTVSIVFASAPSQTELLEYLANAEVPWQQVITYHMDEYIGLSKDASQGFGNFLREKLFDRVNLAYAHYIDSGADDIPAECHRYAELLRKNPVDIVCLGIGENGHIAFNEPYVADFEDPELVKVIELDERSRLQQVHDGCFDRLEQVPCQAITLTVPAITSAGTLFCVVPGSTKAEAVSHSLVAPVSPTYPASVLRTHSGAKLYLDQDSAQMIGK